MKKNSTQMKTHTHSHRESHTSTYYRRMNPFVEIQFPFDRTRTHTTQKLTLRLGLVFSF